MDSKKLDQMMEFIDKRGLTIDSVMILRHGYVVLEEYPNLAYSQDQLHEVHSITKSFISALVGIALREGFLDSVEQKVVDFFPERTIANLDSRKEKMTLEHLLTMTSGLEWDERTYPFADQRNNIRQMYLSGDAVQFVLNRSMANDPGVEFLYNGGCSHLLSAIITKTTGRSTLDFARKFLFDPLGISKVEWERYPGGIYYGAGDLKLKPYDMAKLGYLYLNYGTWNGEQIVPAKWVVKSTESSLSAMVNTSYGYQWWTLPSSGVYFASGAYGQSIFVLPNLDMVIVFTSATPSLDVKEGVRPEPGLLFRFIIPSCSVSLEREQYSKYGFSFDYPNGMIAVERGLAGKETASEVSGEIVCVFEVFPEVIGVIWNAIDSVPDLKTALNKFYESSALQLGNVDRSEFIYSQKDDHEMLYQFFNVTQEGPPLTGVIGSWCCDEVDRIYTSYYINTSEVATKKDLLEEFQRYLDSFLCH
jgi:CubicO group peptidase (beta-lactamase class C family)